MNHNDRRRNGTHQRIAELLENGPMAPPQISQRLGIDIQAIKSCLLGMMRRGEVKRRQAEPGEWWMYSLTKGEFHEGSSPDLVRRA